MASKAAVIGRTTKADLPDELFDEPFHQSLVDEAARADLAVADAAAPPRP